MRLKRCPAAVLVGTITLIVWHLIAQVFPWGAGSVSHFSATSEKTYVVAGSDPQEGPPGTWTTDAFDEQLGGHISTLATDRTFSWIVSAPRESHSFLKDLGFQVLTQAGVAGLLTLLLWLIAPLSWVRRLLAVACAGVAADFAVYGGMMNWMGMPAGYAVGESFNLVVGWTLAFLLIDRVGRRKKPAT